MFGGRNPRSYLNSWRDYIVFGRSATVFNDLARVIDGCISLFQQIHH
jgi:hypothetical protein